MKNVFGYLTGAASTLMAGQALAHPGHDHMVAESALVHALYYGAPAALIAVLVASIWIKSRR